MKILLAAALVAAALLVSVARPAPAGAATPCWKTLLNDWYDGHIDHTYPLHCYQDALKHLPADVQTYSSAHDDILRALQNAKAELRKSGKTPTPNSPVVPPSSGSSTTTTKTSKHGGTTTATTPTSTSPGRHPGGGLDGVAAGSGSSASSVPVPLIVLGALALLLVAAGAAGLLMKRRQGHKPAP